MGTDTANYGASWLEFQALTITLDGVPNDGTVGLGDNVGADIENVIGGLGNDTLVGNDAANVLDGGPGGDAIQGGLGTDTVDYSSRSEARTIKVTLDGVANDGASPPPAPQTGTTEADNVGPDVENVISGPGNDELVGSNSANDLDGGAGDDRLDGGLGPDILRGRAGADRVDYSARTASVTADTDGQAGDDGEVGEGDTVGDDVEILSGGSAADVLTGGPSVNVLSGGGGPDTLTGGAGDDVLDGGAGGDGMRGGADVDTVDYSARTSAITASVDGAGPDDGESAEGDNLAADLERVLGGSGDDVLVGNASANLLDGGAGNDLLDGDLGPDVLVGGPGADVADYSYRDASVQVSIDDAANDGNADDGPSGGRDNVKPDVEDIFGGAGNDSLTGNDADNLLYGGAGADVLMGLAGADIADYSDRQAGVSVTLDGSSNDGNAEDGPAAARDKVALDMEAVVGGAGNDTLVGNGGQNLLVGGPGADVIFGGEGEDLLSGETGDDRLNSRDGSVDGVECGQGADIVAADDLDDVLGDCESIFLPTVVKPPPLTRDTSAPVLSISPRRAQNLRTALARGLVITSGCSEACTIKSRLLLDARVAKKFKLASAARTITVASGSRVLVAAGKVRMVIKFTRKAKRRLKRARKLTLTLTASATDKAGNSRVVRRRVTLRRSAKPGVAGLQTALESRASTHGNLRALKRRSALATHAK